MPGVTAAGNQFKDPHVVFETEEIERAQRHAVAVAVDIGLWSAFCRHSGFNFGVDGSGDSDRAGQDQEGGKK